MQIQHYRFFNYGAGSGNRTRIASLEGWNSTIELHLHFCVFPNDSYYNTIGYYFCQYKFKIFSKIFLNKIFASNLIFINKFRFSPKIPRPHWAKNFERLIKYFYALG
jgi:hypothetical protein